MIKSCGNVFRDLRVPNPEAHLLLAGAKREWNETLKEPIPADMQKLLDKLR